jgi:predicted component of type VI protein secretion system
VIAHYFKDVFVVVRQFWHRSVQVTKHLRARIGTRRVMLHAGRNQQAQI